MFSQGEHDLDNSIDTSQACGTCRSGKEEGDFLFCERDAEVGSYAEGTWSCTRSDCVGKGPCLGFAVDACFRVCQKLTEKW